MTRHTYTVTAAGLLDVQGEERQALLLESDFTDAIKTGAKLMFQEVVILPVDEIEMLTAEVERLREANEALRNGNDLLLKYAFSDGDAP